MGGAAPVVDSSGNIWVEAGNGSVTSPGAPYDHSDSVLELSPALTLLQYFAPSSWASENARDLDLSTAPALLDDGEVVAAGKDGTAYLLDGAHLGGIGGEQTSLTRACCAGHRRRRGHCRHHGLSALPERACGGAGVFQPRRASPSVAGSCRWRAADRRGGPGVEHRPERDPVRDECDHRRRRGTGRTSARRPITSRRPPSATVCSSRLPPGTSSPSPRPPNSAAGGTTTSSAPATSTTTTRGEPRATRLDGRYLGRRDRGDRRGRRTGRRRRGPCGCGVAHAAAPSATEPHPEDQRAERTSSSTVPTPANSREIDTMTAITLIRGRCIGSQSPTSSNTSSA